MNVGELMEDRNFLKGGGFERRTSNFCNAIVTSHDLILSMIIVALFVRRLSMIQCLF